MFHVKHGRGVVGQSEGADRLAGDGRERGDGGFGRSCGGRTSVGGDTLACSAIGAGLAD
jgi:hypothetical protein